MPTITKPNLYFDVVTYTGTGATQTISGLNFQPDFVWIKSRSAATDNKLTDAVRGATKGLISNSTGAETTDSTGITAFTSSGFTLGSSSVYNNSGATYVAWCWKANGSGSSNTAGQITSTVSASTTSGFSIVTFTTDGTTKTVGHGLGVKPSLVIVKVRNGAGSWIVMTDIINGSMQYGALNSTAAFASIGYSAPTSTVFQYNDNNGNTQVAYCFASIEGYSKIGIYTGNGSADGPMVFTGMRPAYLLVKNATSSGDWIVVDAKRNTYNMMDSGLQPNGAYAEASNQNYRFDFLSNGFKVRTTNLEANQSGNTIIFMAFAEAPQKFSLAR